MSVSASVSVALARLAQGWNRKRRREKGEGMITSLQPTTLSDIHYSTLTAYSDINIHFILNNSLSTNISYHSHIPPPPPPPPACVWTLQSFSRSLLCLTGTPLRLKPDYYKSTTTPIRHTTPHDSLPYPGTCLTPSPSFNPQQLATPT